MQLLDELALVVGLEEARLEPQLVRELGDLALELRQREAAVELRRAPLERVEVDAVQDGDAVPHRAASSSIAARRSSSATAAAGARAPGRLDQHEADAPAAALLVALDRGGDGGAVDRRVERGRQPAGGEQVARPRRAAPGCSESVSAASSPSPTASPWR